MLSMLTLTAFSSSTERLPAMGLDMMITGSRVQLRKARKEIIIKEHQVQNICRVPGPIV